MNRKLRLRLAAVLLAAGCVLFAACGARKADEGSAIGGDERAESPENAGDQTDFKEPTDGSFTPLIRGFDAVSSLETGELGGIEQWITIRGENRAGPVLLWLHGGPGLTEIPHLRLQQELESAFVVVNWDQRGAGKSFAEGLSCADMSIDRFVEDARELARYLIERFGKEKIYLLGHSWGAMIGILLAHRHPELFHAFVSVGQPAHNHREEEVALDYVRETAQRLDVKEAQLELYNLSYPYKNREERLIQRKWLVQFGGMIWKKRRLIDCVFDPRTCYPVSEYTEKDWDRRARGLYSSYRCLDIEIEEFDLFDLVKSVELPVFFFLGAHDYQVPFPVSVEYFEYLEAPRKEIVWFQESAHFPHMEETEKFHSLVIEKLLKRGS
jgi:pimeloyl-ACP methyl ester carboxylesterase